MSRVSIGDLVFESDVGDHTSDSIALCNVYDIVLSTRPENGMRAYEAPDYSRTYPYVS